MNGISEMTQALLRYRETGQGLKELTDRVSMYVYRFPAQYYRWNEDRCSDFFLFVYPRITRIIRQFRFNGKSLEAYLYVTLKWQLQSFRQSCKGSDDKWQNMSHRCFWPMEAAEDDATDLQWTVSVRAQTVFHTGSRGAIPNPNYRKRLLIIACLCAWSINDAYIARISELTACSQQWLFERITTLRSLLVERHERLAVLKQQRNHQYYRLFLLHNQLFLEANPASIAVIAARINRIRRRLDVIDYKINHVRMNPTHIEVAAELGIPKGTVNSSVSSLKKQFLPSECNNCN